MAARKLKFKPKPVMGGAVRRPREKEEIPELPSKEPNDEKEAPHENVTSHSDIRNELQPLENANNCEEIASKRLRIEHPPDKSLDPLTINNSQTFDCYKHSTFTPETANGFIGNTSPNITSNENNPEKSKANVQIVELSDFSANKLVSLESVSTQSSTSLPVYPSGSQESQDNEHRSETELTLNTDSNSVTSSNVPQESCHSSKSSEKIETGKALPRLGRLRFKPILKNSVVRKKIDTSENLNNNENAMQSEVHTVAIVRTESVIKCVKSEINKSNIVSEITESFSALESDENTLSQVSTILPYTEENDSFGKICRFDFGSDDVRPTVNETNVNTVALCSDRIYLVNSDKTTQSDKPISNDTQSTKSETGTSILEACEIAEETDSNQLYQILDDRHISEIINCNIQTPPTNKVPISPLKLTSKILVPKPCPNLLDAGVRRISFHGSDSEEESKRKNIFKNDKIGKKMKKEKDVKNNKRKHSQGSTYSKLSQETLEKFTQKFGKVKNLEPTDKAKLTMLDLIFYNPKSNPMSGNTDQTPGVRKKEEKFEVSGVLKEALAEESVDDVEEESSAPTVPVPQVKVGPDGQIMLDPKSLVIETTEVKEKRAEMEKSAVIRDTGITRYNTYSKKKPTRKDWSAQETLQFYKALNTIGSDFSLMTTLFPNRSRHDLKLKFKKEEKTNMKLVDKAMTAAADFDFSSLQEEIKRENDEIAKLAEVKKLAAEAAKRDRAIKKEEREKKKGKRPFVYSRIIKFKDAAFKDFDETEVEAVKKCYTNHKPKSRRKKNSVKKKPDILINSSSETEEELLHIDTDSEETARGESEILKMIKRKTGAGTRKGRKIKQTKKLEEYEEINETLKKALMEIESDSSDGYTPNGLGSDMLFGSPERDPFQDNVLKEGEGSQWSMEVTSVPSVEDTVHMTNVEDVNELSELGSFGENDTALDLSLPVRTSEQDKVAKERVLGDSVLKGHLISESIKIIDQLTSGEQFNVDRENTVDRLDEDRDPLKNSTDQDLKEDQIPLPSFELVNRSRPPVVYSLEEPYIPVESDEYCTEVHEENNAPFVSAEPDHQEDKNYMDNNEKRSDLSYYCNDSEECILGD